MREFTTHFLDQEINNQAEEDLYGKRKQRPVNAAKVKSNTKKELGSCVRQGIYYHCYVQEKKDAKYAECEEHNNKKTIQVNKASTQHIPEKT